MGREVVREGKRIQAVINAAEIKPGDYVTIDALMESADMSLNEESGDEPNDLFQMGCNLGHAAARLKQPVWFAFYDAAGIALYYLGAEVKAVAKVKRALANVAREQTGSGGKRRAAPANPRLKRIKAASAPADSWSMGS